MPTALYIVTFSRGRWWIDTDGVQHGPHASRAEAVSAAIEAAHFFAEPGTATEVVAPDPSGRYTAVWSSQRDAYPVPGPASRREDVSADDLLLAFQLTRDTIAGWSAEAVHYLEAADRAEDNRTPDSDATEAAERTLVAIRMEIEGLSEASANSGTKSDDLVNGIAAAIAEMENLHLAIGGALRRLRALV